MKPVRASLDWIDRVGGVLSAPRRTLAQVAAGRGGFDDLLVLLGLRIVAGELPTLAKAWLSVGAMGALGAVQIAIGALQSVVPDLVAVFTSGLLLLLLGRLDRRNGKGSGAAKSARGRELDLAAAAWVPFVAVKVLFLLAVAVDPLAPAWTAGAARVVAFAWAGALWLLALLALLRGSGAEGGAAASPGTSTRADADSPAAPAGSASDGGPP